ncbi:hypothetical protein [Chryseobacterium sp. MA9]|uniref:hypothetical protein n=1 Tax=Chryseobacterium sp. MA9 TaxID=2966625 RepID=UPI002108054C|nr:hypothetical protein [Chryseobacterium sp. MA9]UTX49923.1 hypothetical protein KIK00_06615 [Chryseobacterium sp. MA9]
MKTPLLVILSLIIFSCAQKNEKKFEQISDYPKIKDSSLFIKNLRQTFDLTINESPEQEEGEKITAFKKVKINGSDQDYYFIEYDWKTGPTAGYPWKNQILLTSEGKLVKILFAQRYEFIKIFPKQNPFLLATLVTGHGNGGHEIYKVTADSLVNIYDGNVKTYDTDEDNRVYEPHELQLKIKDYNNDGFNDIAFTGKIVLIQGRAPDGFWYDNTTINGRQVKYSVENPFKKFPVEYIFLYNQKTGHFKAKGDYREKYKLFD